MFEVIWKDEAMDALADAFVASDLPTQDAIARVVASLNQRFAADPYAPGESRSEPELRIVLEKPCILRYAVNEAEGVVRVTGFWVY